MSYRAASRIEPGDSAELAEHKALTAQAALCNVHIAHFTRMAALIDYAAAHKLLDDLTGLYPYAFGTADIPAVDPGKFSHSAARQMAQQIVDEMRLSLHELEWSDAPSRPPSADETMLRKSHAVVSEDRSLKRLAEVRQKLRVFENELGRRPWSVHFKHPAPFSSNSRS
ncbi:hypothetical protein [Rhodococcus pyridinivorans]|uniref:hypothetical protein n=1 Tax=Rhodococcus pyridinivorans TaxID=103816 RepID=UPI002659AA61|nr:hypothetical protein [Rhodococcus pyridinivorans]